MAQTTYAKALEKYERTYFKEYVRESGFAPYMGTGVNNPFVTKRQLIQGGQVINIPLVSALNGNGKGTGTLVGNEEKLNNYNYDVKPYWHRNAVLVQKDQQHETFIDLHKAGRDMLKIWDMDDMRDSTINALSAVAEASASYDAEDGHPKQVFYSEATAAQKNTWNSNNQYRVLFGNAESNFNATHATALATVDAAGDALTAANITLMKRLAKRRQRISQGDSVDVPALRPIRTGKQGREYFVMFTDSINFAKVKTDSTIAAANRDARPRDVDENPIFQDGDLIYDGVIIREIPEISATSSTVSPAYLCGAQALAHAWGQLPKATRRKEDDYEFQYGVGTESLWACEKLIYNNLDHGVFTGFFYTG